VECRPIRSLGSLALIDSVGSRKSAPCPLHSPLPRLASLSGIDPDKLVASGASGGAAGSAVPGVGTGAGAAIGVGAYLASETPRARGVDDPAAGHTGAYLVDHPEARGGLSKAECYRMAFRDLGDRMWVNDTLQACQGGWVPISPQGYAYGGEVFTLEPAGWGYGPHELWRLSEWATLGRSALAGYREVLVAAGKAPSWYKARSEPFDPEAAREADRAAYGGEGGYFGEGILGSSGVGGSSAPVGRPGFQATAPARTFLPSIGGESSSSMVWLLLLGGAGLGAYLLLRTKGRR